MAGAPIGNSNASKWTLESAQSLCDDISEYVKNNKECYSITEACVELGYYETLLDYFRTKFENTIDFEPIKRAFDIIKARLLKNGIKGDTNATMSIFVLKNNHGMKDKTEQEVSGKLDLSKYTDEELQAKLDKLTKGK